MGTPRKNFYKGFAEMEVFGKYEKDLLSRVTKAVAQINKRDESGRLLRCHELARAVAFVFELEVVDGHRAYVEHSWCVTPTTALAVFPRIIDVYVPGCLPSVQLVDTRSCLDLYKPGDKRGDINDSEVTELCKLLNRSIKDG